MRPQNAYLQDPTSFTQGSNSLFHNQNTYPDFCMVTLSLPTHAPQFGNDCFLPHSFQLLFTNNALQTEWSGEWILLWGEIFHNHPDQPWGPPSLPHNGYQVSFWGKGVKQPGHNNHPLPSSVEVKQRVELYFSSPSGIAWPDLGWILTLIFTVWATDIITKSINK